MPRKTFKKNQSWTVLFDLLVGEPEEFNPDSSSIRGRVTRDDLYPSLGQLPQEFWNSARSADYAVYSYQTPIAWRVDGRWVCPGVHYSRTTSGQQNRVRTALSQVSGGFVEYPETLSPAA